MKNDFDSKEELYFSWYLKELEKNNIVEYWKKIEEPIILTKGLQIEYIKPMIRVEDKLLTQNILPSREYTPDFLIKWNTEKSFKLVNILEDPKDTYSFKFKKPFIARKVDNELISLIEIKAKFDRNNMTRLFKQNQSWLWDKAQIYINLVKVPDIFKKTFTPNRYLLTDKTKKPRKINFKTITINEYYGND